MYIYFAIYPWELIEEAKNDQAKKQHEQPESRPSILQLQEGKFGELY